MKEKHRAAYTSLMVSGKLNSYLAGIDQQAQEMYLRLVEQMAKGRGCD